MDEGFDADGDGHPSCDDCDPADGTVFATPGEVSGLGWAADTITLTWDSAIPNAGSSTLHTVIRGNIAELPVGAGASEICIAGATSAASAEDASTPLFPETGTWYLGRASNACGTGTYGLESDGSERLSLSCP